VILDTIKRYAEISAATYTSTYPTPPGGIVIIKQTENCQTDSQGFMAPDSTARGIIASFRVTSNFRDFPLIWKKTRTVSASRKV
jgi:hypothetical protein